MGQNEAENNESNCVDFFPPLRQILKYSSPQGVKANITFKNASHQNTSTVMDENRGSCKGIRAWNLREDDLR